MSTNTYALARLPVYKRPQGYYLRWWYNGWHYWQFFAGGLTVETSGEDYRTYAQRSVTVSSGQLTEAQASAVRTITNTSEVYIWTDTGWRLVRLTTGTMQISNNYFNGYEIQFSLTIGSRLVSITGFSPVVEVPIVIPDTERFCELEIGEQIWMCANWDAAYPASRVYMDKEASREEYGGLYRGTQILNDGFAPAGYHLPTQAEWEKLFAFVATNWLDAGKELKAAGVDYWLTGNTGVDTVNFNARGGGYYDGLTARYKDIKSHGYFWTASPNGTRSHFVIDMPYNGDYAMVLSMYDVNYASVRFIKDEVALLPYVTLETTLIGLFSMTLAGSGAAIIDWGDGTIEPITLSLGGAIYTHTLAAGGTITVNSCEGLTKVDAASMSLTAAVVEARCVNIKEIYFNTNGLTDFLTQSAWTALTHIYINANQLTDFVLQSSWADIVAIDVSDNLINSLTIPDMSASSGGNIFANGNLLASVDLTNLATFVQLNFSSNLLTTVICPPTGIVNWQYVFLYDNAITSFVLDPAGGNIADLVYLWLSQNDLATFTLQDTAINLESLTLWESTSLASLTPHAEWGENKAGIREFVWASCALDVTTVNLILTTFDAITGAAAWTTGDNIALAGGTNAAPTGAGITAKNSLQAKGVIVQTNE